MKITWYPNAEERLRTHIRHIAKEAPLTAQNIFETIWEETKLLADFPQLGKIYKISKNTRELTIKRTFKIIYEVRKETVFILHFHHTKQKSTMK